MKPIFLKTIFVSAAFLMVLVAPFGVEVYNTGEGISIVEYTAFAQQLENPLNVDSPEALIGNVISALLGLSGTLALLMFVWGGIQWLTSGGNPDRIEKGKRTLIWALAGLVLIFSAYAIVYRVIDALTGATGTG